MSISGTNTVTIASGNTIKATAARVTGKSIIGEGTLDILAIESTLGLDISGVTVTTITGALNSADNKEFTAAAKLSDATITILNGTVTANASAVMPDGTGGFVVGASATLKLTAIHSDSLIASGGGNMTIDNLNGDAAADLSGISTTGTNTVNTLGDMTFTGKFPVKALTLDGSGAMTMTSNDGIIDNQLLTISGDNSIVAEASLITGKSISGAGDLTINKLNETAVADLSGISTMEQLL